MNNNPNDKSVLFLYGTKPGRVILSIILAIKIPALLGLFLRSIFSVPFIKPFIKKNSISQGRIQGEIQRKGRNT